MPQTHNHRRTLKTSRARREMLHGTTATTVAIPTVNRLRGQQKNRRNQKISVRMMKRLSRTGALPRPGIPVEAVGVSRRNGLLRNGPTISTASDGPGCDDVRKFRIFFFDFLARFISRIFFELWFFFPVKKMRTSGKKKIGCGRKIAFISVPLIVISHLKKGVNSSPKNPESERFAGFDFCISPKWAPFKWKWPPVWSKTPGLFAWTGGPEHVRQNQNTGNYPMLGDELFWAQFGLRLRFFWFSFRIFWTWCPPLKK